LGLRLGQEKYWRSSLEKEWDYCLAEYVNENETLSSIN